MFIPIVVTKVVTGWRCLVNFSSGPKEVDMEDAYVYEGIDSGVVLEVIRPVKFETKVTEERWVDSWFGPRRRY